MNVSDLAFIKQSGILRRLLCLVIFILAALAPFASSQDVPPGAYQNDKMRLVSHVPDDGDLPIIFNVAFAVRDSDGLVRQENTGDQFYVRWKVEILKGGSVVKTLERDEPIVPPFNWVQLPRLTGSGTEPFVQVTSSQSWDGKNEAGQPVPGATLQYRVSGIYIRILPRNGQLTVIGAVNPATGSFEADGEPPTITITGVTDGEYRNENIHITVNVSDTNGVTEKVIKLDDVEVGDDFTVTDEGTHKIEVLARDPAGNTATKELTFTIDRTDPQIVLPTITPCSQDPASLDFTVTDANIDTVNATLNGTAVQAGTIVDSEGDYVLAITATDLAGNSATSQLSFTIDRTPPAIQIAGVQPNQFYETSVTPVIETNEPATITATLNGQPYTSGTPVQTDDNYTLMVTATDCAGNTSTVQVNFGIDTAAPVISVTPDLTDESFTNQNVSFDVQITDANLTDSEILLDGQPYTSGTAITAEQLHTLEVTASDPVHTSTYSRTFTIDKTAPVVTITEPADGSYSNHSITSIVDVQDANPDAVEYKLDGVIVAADFSITDEGVHTLVVTATDKAGNTGSATSTFTIDTTAPQVAITNLMDGTITNQDVTLHAEATDANPDRIELTLNGNAVANDTVVTDEGDYELTAVAIDKAGNESAPATLQFSIDKTKPVISVTGVTDGSFVSATVTPQITVTDLHLGTTTITLDGTPYIEGTPISTDGSHTLLVTATDAAGNEATPVTIAFTIDTLPPVVTIGFPQEGRYYGTNITPQITIEEANIATKEFTLNGAAYTEGTPITAEATHALSVTVTDKARNSASASVTFTIDKTAPVITITGVEPDRFYAQHPTVTVGIQEANLESSTILLDNSPFTSGTQVTTQGRHELIVTARDKANHTSQKRVAFGVDTVPPVIHIQAPQDGTLVNFDSIQVSGTLQEEFLKEVTVNGAKAIASSDLFVANNVHLGEGSNTITVVAVDLAGGSAQATVTVQLDQTPPDIVIASPANGAQLTQSLIAVTGSIGGADIGSVTVNGIPAVITAGQFVASNLRLSEGVNTIRAIATDTAGNTQQASVQVTLDTQGPRIAITEPVDGSFTTATSTDVSGFVFDVTAPAVTVNGTAVTVGTDGYFTTNVSLSEGNNLITIIARDALNNQISTQISVTHDSRPPQVVSIAPADGSIGVPPGQLITITFSEDVKKSTVTSNTVKLMQAANLVTGTLSVSGRTVTLAPHQPLAGAATFTLTVETGITDLIGNALAAQATATFSTLDDQPPAAPTIDPPLPAVTSDTLITVMGTAEANSKVEITGGSAKVTALASETGHYSVQVSLFEDAVNQLSVTATDLTGNTSAAATATIIQDSIRMVALDASFELDGSILIDFSKPVNLASITPQNIYAVASATITGSVIATSDPARVVFYPQTPLGTSPFVLKVEATVQDQSGRALEYPFSKLFNAAAGDSFVQGEVWDNAIGQPLAGATVSQIVPVATPAPVATTDLRGQFVLPASSGNVVVRIERPNYLTVDRAVNAPAGQAVIMFDARLERSDSQSLTLTTAATTLANSDGSVTLDAPANTVASDTPVRLTKRDGQSLPALLPDGWSPVGVATIASPTSSQSEQQGSLPAVLSQPVTLRVSNDFGLGAFSSMPTAYYDSSTMQWLTGPSGFVTSDGKYLEVQTTRTGTHAFLFFDPTNPPAPTLPDQPLHASPLGEPVPAGTPNLVATPTGIYPDQRALVDVGFAGNEFRSGTHFQAILSENFQLLAGLGSVQTTPRTADLVGYSLGDPSGGKLQFFATPSKAVDFATLDVGFIDVEIHAFPHSTDQPGIIGSNGGSAQSADGSQTLEVPAGALTRSVPVTIVPLKTNAISLVLADYTLVAATDISLGGATLTSGATLTISSLNLGTLDFEPLILARLAQIGSKSLWVLEGTCTYDGAKAVCNNSVGPASLPGIKRSGVYGVFAPQVAIGFLTGSITNPQSTAAGAGILVTSNATALVALSNATSTYTLAVPVPPPYEGGGQGEVGPRATATNLVSGDSGSAPYALTATNQLVTLHLQIVTTPPRVTSISPAAGATNVATNTAVRVTFSEAILASSLNSTTFYLDRGAGVPARVSGQILLTSNNTIGIFTPSTALVSDAEYTLTVTSGIKDLTGNALANPVSGHTFRIADTTAPAANANAAFKLFLPEGPNAPQQGTVRFEVPEADIETGTAVIFFNNTQQTSTSATVNPCASGGSCFTASIAGRITDTYFVELVDAADNQTRIDLPRMEYPDGSGAVFGPTGGEYTTSEGILIEITDGTFDTATPLQVKFATPAPQDVPAQPRDFATLGFFTLDAQGTEAKKEINLGFPIPQGITADNQVFVVKPVEYFGKKRWMPVEELFIEDGLLKTQSPPWPGVKTLIDPRDAFSLVVAHGTAPLFYLVGTVARAPAVIEFDVTDLIAYVFDCNLDRLACAEFVMILPVNQNYQMRVSDVNTGAILFEGMPVAPATEAQGTVHLRTPLSNDITPPYVIGGSPLTFSSWKVGSAQGTIRPLVQFAATDGSGSNSDGIADATGELTITGFPGALPEDAYVALRNNSSGNADWRHAEIDGSFSLLQGYNFGDPVTLVMSSVDVDPGATLRFTFSEPVSLAGNLQFYETEDRTTVKYSYQLLHASQILEVRPTTSLKTGREYTIVLQNIYDLSANGMPQPFEVRFQTKSYDITSSASSGTVHDTVLLKDHLLVGKDTGVEVYSTANPFDLQLVSTLPLNGGVRSFAQYGNYVMAVGGGLQPHYGLLHQLDFSNMQSPRVEASLILTRFVGDTSDDILNEENPIPEGRPIKVMVLENYAFVATLGVGVQVIDITRIREPRYNVTHPNYNEPTLKDIALYFKADNPGTPQDETALNLLLSGSSMHDDANNSLISFKAVDIEKVIAQGCSYGTSSTSETRCQVSKLSSTVIPGPANHMEVLLRYEVDIDQDGRTGVNEDTDDFQDQGTIVSERDAFHTDPRSYEVHDLAFIASGTFGIHVLDVTNVKEPVLLGTIPIGDGLAAGDLKLDAENLRLYAPVGADGIYIIDIKDPFLINPDVAPQVIGKIQIPNTITDGSVTIDSELNTVYVGTRDKGVNSVMVGQLRMKIVTDRDHDGIYEDVSVIASEGVIRDPISGEPWDPATDLSVLQAQDPTEYYVHALLPSAAGAGVNREVKVRVNATNFFGQAIHMGAGFPETAFETTVQYRAPVNANQDSYRVYISQPFYITGHPTLPSPDKMVAGRPVLAAGDFVRLQIDEAINQSIDFVTTDLLRQSEFSTRAVRMEWVDTSQPESRYEPPMGSGESGYPPYLHSGEWTLPTVDFTIRGRGLDFAFARKYESQALYDGPLGQGWDHIYFARLMELPSGDVFYFDGMGRKELFQFTEAGYIPPPGVFVYLQKLIDGNWLITESNGLNRLFNSYGQLIEIQDRNENKLEFYYDPIGRLALAVDTMGRPIVYEYDGFGKLAKVRDFAQREWTFHYEAPGPEGSIKAADLLTSVATPPVGTAPRVTQYGYGEPVSDSQLLPSVNLVSITDPRSVTYLVNEFDSADRLIRQQFGSSTDIVQYEYGASLAKVTDRNGNLTDYILDPEGQVERIVEHVENNAQIETSFEHTADGLLKNVTLPRGNKAGMGYPDVDEEEPNRRGAGNITGRSFEGTDVSGNVVKLESSFAYQERFNIANTMTDPEGHEVSLGFDGTDRNAGQISRPEGVIVKHEYNKYGQVTKTIDGEGHAVVYEYYPEADTSQAGTSTITRNNPDIQTGGYLRAKTYDVGGLNLRFEYKYDSRGNIVEMTDPRGVKTVYSYNSLDEVVGVVKAASGTIDGEHPPLNFRMSYAHDANGNVAEILVEKDPGKFSRVRFEYDSLNSKVLQAEEVEVVLDSASTPQIQELTTIYEYDGNRNLTKVVFPEGNEVRYEYDSRDQKTAEIRGAGSQVESRWTYEYDGNKNMIRETDSRGTTVYEYDPLDRLLRITDPEGNEKRLDYNLDSQLVKESYFDSNAVLLAATEYERDGVHRVKKEKVHLLYDPDQAQGVPTLLETGYTYNKDNQVTQILDPKSRLTIFSFDGVHRKTATLDAAGNSTEYEYDGNDNITRVIEKLKATAGSHSTDAEYVITNRYDALNRSIETVDLQNHRTSYRYDLRNNLLATEDALGNIVSFTYDDLNRKTAERIVARVDAQDPSADVLVKYAYDKNSRLLSYTDARGNETTYSYDERDRLKATEYPLGGVVRMTYDGNDNLITAVDRNGTQVVNQYDSSNRLIRKDITRGAGVLGTTFETYEYDGLNRVTRVTDDDSDVRFFYDSRGLIWKEVQNGVAVESRFDEVGNPVQEIYPGQSFIVQRAFDEIDRLKSLTTDGVLSTCSYLGPDRITDKLIRNGIRSLIDYDSEGKLIDITHGTESEILSGFGYQWDGAHYRTSEAHHHRADAADTYSYDGAHRIRQANLASLGGSNRQFMYDSTDNITTSVHDGVSTSYAVNAENQYVTGGTAQFEYDANGNLTLYSDGTTEKRFAYDYMNRMVSAEITKDGATNVVNFAYDPLGRRIGKSSSSETTRYIYSGEQVVQERDASGNVIREYIWGEGVDELEAIRQNGSYFYVHTNSIGSIAAITDSAGNIIERYDYDIFGQPTVTYTSGTPSDPSVSSIGQPYSFQGREWEPETGLFYFRARYYSPQLGRFINQDPEMYEDSPSLYAFANNDPVNSKDPSGRLATNVVGGALSVGIGWGFSKLAGEEYSWKDAAVDFGLGFASSGLSSINKIQKMGKVARYLTRAGLEVAVDVGLELARQEMKGEEYEVGDLLEGAAKNFLIGEAGAQVGKRLSKGVKKLFGSDNLTEAISRNDNLQEAASKRIPKPETHPVCCFAAGTEILTQGGIKPIEEIKEGDFVVAFDSLTGRLEIRAVTATFQRQVDELVVITVGTEVIETTIEHPFWVVGKGWVDAVRLQPGDQLQTASGSIIPITGITRKSGYFAVYNFEVDGHHNYFVSESAILAHNEECNWFKGVREVVATGHLRVVKRSSGVVRGTPAVFEHHIFLQHRATEFWDKYRIDVDDYVVDLDKVTHEAIHQGRGKKGLGTKAGWWESELMERIQKFQALKKGKLLTIKELEMIGRSTLRRFGLGHLQWHRYTKSKK